MDWDSQSTTETIPLRTQRHSGLIAGCQKDFTRDIYVNNLLRYYFGVLEETTRTPLHHVDEDYPAGPEIQQPLPEWSNWRGSESSTLETDVYIWRYALLAGACHKRRRYLLWKYYNKLSQYYWNCLGPVTITMTVVLSSIKATNKQRVPQPLNYGVDGLITDTHSYTSQTLGPDLL